MEKEEINQIRKHLAFQLEKYILIFKEEFKNFIPIETLEFLNSITDYEKFINIEDTGTITCYVKNREFYFPLLADKILNSLKSIPGFGCKPNHRTYQDNNLVINDNTFIDYIKHAFLAGLSTLEFYKEMMLHETMHFCGIAGATAFQEGLTELKTRELAKKYNLKTNACGYPKEVKIVYRLQEIFGEDLMNKIAFNMSMLERRMIIYDELGKEGVEFFDKVSNLMELEFQNKYYKYHSSFIGLTAPLKKAKKYEEIDYTEVYRVIDEYCNKHKNNEIKNTIPAKK